MTSVLRPGMVIDKDQQAADRAYKEKLDAEARAMAATARTPADKNINPAKIRAERAAAQAKIDAAKAASTRNAAAQIALKNQVAQPKPFSSSNSDAVGKALTAKSDAELVAKGAGTTPTPVKPDTFTRTPPKPVSGGIRAWDDPSNPEMGKALTAKSDAELVAKGAGITPLPGPSGGLGATMQSADFSGINGGPTQSVPMKKGGRVKAKAKSKSSYSSGGKVSSASKRGDGCAQRGKTKGRMI